MAGRKLTADNFIATANDLRGVLAAIRFERGISWARGAADRPYPPSSPAHGAAARGGRGGAWRMEEEDTGGGLVRCSPQNVAATALAWGIYNPAPAAGDGGGGGGGGPRWKGE